MDNPIPDRLSLRPVRTWYTLNRWRKIAKWQLRNEPLCRLCQNRGLVRPATIADHIEPHRGDINKFWFGKLQSLCFDCHNTVKQGIEQRGFDTAVGADGWAIDPKHPVHTGAFVPDAKGDTHVEDRDSARRPNPASGRGADLSPGPDRRGPQIF